MTFSYAALRQLQPFVQLLVAFMEMCAKDPESSSDIMSAMIGVIGYATASIIPKI
jgi:hypothetical protein